MRTLLLPLVIGGLMASAVSTQAQDILEKKSDDPLVQAAYAKTATPSGVPYREKDMGLIVKIGLKVILKLQI